MPRLTQGMNTGGTHLKKLGVRYGEDDGIVGVGLRFVFERCDLVFMFGFGDVDPRVVDVDLGMVAGEFAHDVDDFRVAQVGAALFEGETENEDPGVDYLHLAPGHEFDHFVGHIAGHAVVDAPPGEDDFGVVTDLLCLVGQVVGVDADTVAADQPGPEGQKVPFAACGFEDFEGVDTEAMEDQGEFVHQGDIEVALGVFDDLGGFGDLDRAGLVRAGGDDAAIKGIDELGDFGGGARGDFFDGGQAVRLVAGVDAFGAVAAIEVAVEAEAGVLFEERDADFFGGAGVDGGFVDDDGAFGYDLADGFGGLDQGRKVGPLSAVDRGGYGDDEDIACAQLFGVGSETELFGFGQFGGLGFAGAVTAGLEFVDTALLDVEAGDRILLAEFDGQRQADVAEADDRDADVSGWGHDLFIL